MVDMKAFHATVEGDVQGVGFRFAAIREAQKLDIGGWVRNTPEGNVEVLAEGEEDSLEEFLAWLRQGPPAAWVREVTVTWEPPAGGSHGFNVRWR